MYTDEHIIEEDFHAEFDQNLFYDLVADDILDPDINKNNPNMKGDRKGSGQQDPQRMVVVDHKRNLPKFLVRRLYQQTYIFIH